MFDFNYNNILNIKIILFIKKTNLSISLYFIFLILKYIKQLRYLN